MSRQPRLDTAIDANRQLHRARQRERQLDVVDRLRQLQVILPAMALEAAVAKRDAARLRRENVQLLRRLSKEESPGTAA
jgi:hypothetical protein